MLFFKVRLRVGLVTNGQEGPGDENDVFCLQVSFSQINSAF